MVEFWIHCYRIDVDEDEFDGDWWELFIEKEFRLEIQKQTRKIFKMYVAWLEALKLISISNKINIAYKLMLLDVWGNQKFMFRIFYIEKYLILSKIIFPIFF